MGNETTIVRGKCATFAWLGIAVIIAVVAAIGILCNHGQTAAIILSITAAGLGLCAALGTLSGKIKTPGLIAATAALSAGAGLLVKEADTIVQMVTKPDVPTLIAGGVLLAIAFMIVVIYKYNSGDDALGTPSDGTPPETTTSEGKSTP